MDIWSCHGCTFQKKRKIWLSFSVEGRWKTLGCLNPLQSMEINFAKCKRFTGNKIQKIWLHYRERNKAVNIKPCMQHYFYCYYIHYKCTIFCYEMHSLYISKSFMHPQTSASAVNATKHNTSLFLTEPYLYSPQALCLCSLYVWVHIKIYL